MASISEAIEGIRNIGIEGIIDIWIAIAIIIVFRIFRGSLTYIIIKMFKFKEKSSKKIKANAFYEPLKSFFGFLGIYLAIWFLSGPFNISQEFMDIVTKIFKIVIIITTAVGLAKSITIKSGFMKKIQEKSDKDLDKSTLIIIVKIIRALIYVIAGFMVITDLGYNLNGLIAGLGIGSVVITLAAQDTAKNLVGSLTIMFDQSLKIGDYIKIGTYEGTVEDITFKSTKIRALDGSVIYIPNSKIASSELINCSQKTKNRYRKIISLDMATPLDKIENCKLKILATLTENELVDKNSVSVRFTDISTNGMDMLIDCFIDSIDDGRVTTIKEEFNYKIMQIFNNEGVKLV